MAALTRSQNAPGGHDETPDIDLDDGTSVEADFGGSLKDSIIVTRKRMCGTHGKKKMAMLEWEDPKPPKFLKLRVYWARLLRW